LPACAAQVERAPLPRRPGIVGRGGRLGRWREELPLGVQDRDADIWEPLLAVADAVDGMAKARPQGCVALVAAAKESEPSLGLRLLADLKTAFGEVEQMSTKAVLRALIDMEEAPWGDLKGKPLDERGLARRLRVYGIKSISVRIGEDTPKGYKRQDLLDAWERYFPPSPATSATPPQPHPQDFQGDNVADVADVADLATNIGRRRAGNGGVPAMGPDPGDPSLDDLV
jgi:hypothetical protein